MATRTPTNRRVYSAPWIMAELLLTIPSTIMPVTTTTSGIPAALASRRQSVGGRVMLIRGV
jgi:hypothetical protein